MKAHEPVARVRRPAADVLDGIGDTSLIRVEGIWAKLGYLNPSGP